MMKTNRSTRGLWLAVALLTAPAGAMAQTRSQPVHCAPISVKTVKGLLTQWTEAIQEQTPDKVMALYADDATLLPTSASGPLTKGQIRAYFVNFLNRRPVASIDEATQVITLGCNLAYDIGLYAFEVNGQTPPARDTIHARYTFLYKWDGAHWKIAHHHSSRVP